MNVVDANVLLYAVNTSARHHDSSRQWLDDALSGAATVGFSWIVMLAFMRLATKDGVFPSPLTVAAADEWLTAWLAQPTSVVVEPTSRHLELVSKLLEPIGTGGNLVNDAHVAALAVEHRGSVVSYDHDFARFTGVRWRRPGDR